MAKAAKLKIKLLSSAGTGYFYVTSKNSRTKGDKKLSFKKYDPVARSTSSSRTRSSSDSE